ncbi:MAG: hypothetical protein C0599_11920 [Salinivirgaceae bacterium]|nr:MAG: hypothetical protein C0599_11920 [Salinivirgaceae bacterium]
MNQLIANHLLLLFLFSIVFITYVHAQESEEELIQKYITNSKPFTDKRDGKTYKTIKIGKQIWMAENLAFKSPKGYYAYDDNESIAIDNGYLYEWQVAINVCPEGWSLPNKNDFLMLLYTVSKISKKPSKELIVGGCSGFEAKQSGWRDELGYYSDLGENGNYWSSTKSISGRSWLLFVGKKGKKSYLDFAPYKIGVSVRCIKNK